MKSLFLAVAIYASAITEAQINSVSLQASGLTCSMCSNAVNKALRSLDFVKNVDPDIKTYTFEITFKPNSYIDFDLIRKSVEKAGFTVCAFVANIHFDHLPVRNGQPVKLQSQSFLFLDTADQVLDGDKTIRLIDKGFVSAKEYKRNPLSTSLPQTYHVKL